VGLKLRADGALVAIYAISLSLNAEKASCLFITLKIHVKFQEKLFYSSQSKRVFFDFSS